MDANLADPSAQVWQAQAPTRKKGVAPAPATILLFSLFLLCFILTTFRTPIPKSVINVTRWLMLFGVFGYFLLLPRRRIPAICWPVFIFLFCGVLSSINAEAQVFSMAKMLPAATALILFFYLIPSALRVENYVRLYTATAILLNIMSALSFMAGILTGKLLNPVRYQCLFVGPNSEGVYAAFALMGALWLYSAYPKSLLRFLAQASVAANAFAIYATSSRSSFFGVVAGGLVWGATQMLRAPAERRWRLLQITFVLAGFVYMQRGFFASKWQDMTRSATSREEFLVSREWIWMESYEAFRKKPLMGHGFGVSALVPEDKAVGVVAYAVVRDGAGYLGLLESLGILGTAAFILVLLHLSFSQLRIFISGINNEYTLLAQCAFATVAFLLVNLVGEPWIIGPGNPTFHLFWFNAATAGYFSILAIRKWKQEKRAKAEANYWRAVERQRALISPMPEAPAQN